MRKFGKAGLSAAAVLAALALASPAGASQHSAGVRVRAAAANGAAAGKMPAVNIRSTSKGVARYHPTSLSVAGRWTNTSKPCARKFASFKVNNKTATDQTINYNGSDLSTIGSGGAVYVCATPGLGSIVLGLDGSKSTLSVTFS